MSKQPPAVPVLPVALLLLGSGFCALVYQVAWLRLLRLTFGASTAASAAVLAIFMGGLGLGGLLLGRRVDRLARPLAFYGILEVGVSLAALSTPFLVQAARAGYVALGGTFALGPFFGTCLRLLLAALVLGLPTFLMGGTLPAVARAVEHGTDRGRRHLALLYGANTLGAVSGALVTTFLALEMLGVRRTIWAAVLLNLAVAAVAFLLSRRYREGDAPETADAAAEQSEASPPAGGGRRAPVPFVLATAALVGFAFLLMELVWYRMLAPLLGGSSYTFGLILAVALLGIGLGGLLYAAGPRGRRPTLAAFAGTCSLEALFLLIPFALGDRVAVLTVLLRSMGEMGFLPLVASWTMVTALVVLLPAIVAGYQFPLLVAVLGSGRESVGREVGLTYAWNTVGAIVGSIAGGFGLIPLLSAPVAWRAVALLLLALAALSLLLAWRRGERAGVWVPVLAGGLSLILVWASGPTAFWRHSPIGAGRVQAAFGGPNDLIRTLEERRRAIVWEAEGVESSVGLLGQAQHIFLINGKADGSALRDAPNMVLSVLVGATLHPQPERSLVIGLGSGLSAGWLAEVPSMERVDVVELEPSINHIAELCAPVNFDVLNHPKVELMIGDGRELLLTSDVSYDLIFSQPSNPYRAGIASLFSREFYQSAADRLRPGGLLLQWLQGYEVDPQVVGMAYATLRSVFPHVESWQVHANDLLLVASREPLPHDLARIRERVREEPLARALDQIWGVEGVEGFYSGYVAGPQLAEHLGGLYAESLNTDDHPRMEFGFVRSLGREGLFQIDQLRALGERLGAARPAGIEPRGVDWRRVAEMRTVRQAAWGSLPLIPEDADSGLDHRIKARRAYRQEDLRRALLEWSAQGQGPDNPHDWTLLAEVAAEHADPRVPEYLQAIEKYRPVEGTAILARWFFRQGDVTAAAESLLEVFEKAKTYPWIYPALLKRGLDLAQEIAAQDQQAGRQLYEALAEPFSVGLLEEPRKLARIEVARRVDWAGLCGEAFAPFEPHVPWDGRFLLDRFRCYQASGHALAASAQQDVQKFLDNSPPRLETGLLTEEMTAG